MRNLTIWYTKEVIEWIGPGNGQLNCNRIAIIVYYFECCHNVIIKYYYFSFTAMNTTNAAPIKCLSFIPCLWWFVARQSLPVLPPLPPAPHGHLQSILTVWSGCSTRVCLATPKFRGDGRFTILLVWDNNHSNEHKERERERGRERERERERERGEREGEKEGGGKIQRLYWHHFDILLKFVVSRESSMKVQRCISHEKVYIDYCKHRNQVVETRIVNLHIRINSDDQAVHLVDLISCSVLSVQLMVCGVHGSPGRPALNAVTSALPWGGGRVTILPLCMEGESATDQLSATNHA